MKYILALVATAVFLMPSGAYSFDASSDREQIEERRVLKKLSYIDSRIEAVDQSLLSVSRKMNILAQEIKDLNDQEHLLRQSIQAQAEAKSETARTIARLERMPVTALLLSDSIRDAHTRLGVVRQGRASLQDEMATLRSDVAELRGVLAARAEKILELQDESDRQKALQRQLSRQYTEQLKLLQVTDEQRAKMLARAHDMKKASTLNEMMRLQAALDDILMPQARDSGVKAALQGVVVAHFNEKNSLGVRAHGVTLALTPSSPVYALKDGRVVFSDAFGTYKHVVILEHSDGANSLYSGLGGSHVSVGDFIHAGKALGKMSNIEEPRLYIEVRKGDAPVDPVKWL